MRMTGGEALAKQLQREGVRVVFGLPGVQLYGAMAALRDEKDIRFILTRHEQATTYMADGYARAGGGVGVALVVPGPGVLNAGAGLSTAYSCSSPVFLVAGQVPRRYLGKDVGVLHEINEQLDVVKPVTKWRKRVLEVGEIPGAVQEAFRQLKTGRPRPVHLEIPPDTLEEEGEAELLPAVTVARTAAPDADIERAARVLLDATRPIIYAGGGVHASGAHEALTAVAEYLQAGVVQSAEGKGSVSDQSDLALGAALWPKNPLRDYLDAADTIFVVGSRCAVAGFQPTQKIVQLDVDAEEIGRNHPVAAGLVGDARLTLERLLERLRTDAPPKPSRKREREQLREAVAGLDTQEPNHSILASLRAGTPEDAIVIAGMTQIGYYSRPFWPVYRPRTYLTSSYSGNLGFEVPTALGAKVARPDRAVICITGDGGFMYNSQELSTAAREKINAVIVLFNDEAYGNVARDLDESWGGTHGASVTNPDFMKLADAYGVVGMRATQPTDVGDLVRKAVGMDRPVLIEVRVGRMARPAFFAPMKAPAKYQKR
ncbi:MAG TPA: thiamine pyrophosphate-dependent enzyme [Patescibacteria group bacterium]|jgi:acetolactate synthase I/II/III large subunit|nr:thiamine pyrophosphate-dependent enzyme [Patescibacteria group bacterium]